MSDYEAGKFKYFTTLPTDALRTFRDVMLETKAFGFAKARIEQFRMGRLVRSELLRKYGFKGVPEKEYQSPGVIVLYIPKTMEGWNVVRDNPES